MMAFSRSMMVAVVASGLVLGGCAAKDGSNEKVDATEADLSGTQYLGTIADGDTISAHYSDPPKYRAYGFYAKGGDSITVDVTSEDGDAMGWITDSSYRTLASNDDANSDTLDSHVTYKVPAGTAKKAYRIVFRDYDRLAATFDVSLEIKSSGTGGTTTCNPATEPDRNYIGTSTTCATIRFTCPVGQKAFSNACGCGCETN